MQNSGVTIRDESQHFTSVHDDNPCVAFIPYFGFIEEIWELNYSNSLSVFSNISGLTAISMCGPMM